MAKKGSRSPSRHESLPNGGKPCAGQAERCQPLHAQEDLTERERLERQLKADLAALARIHDLSTRLLATDGLKPLLQEVVNTAVAIMGAERGTLQLMEGDSLRIVAHHGHLRPFLEFFASVANRASACGEALKRGQRVVVEDIECHPLFVGTASLKVLREAGVRAVQCTPLRDRQGTLLGVLATQWSAPHVPDEHDLWRLDLLVRQAADLIEHKRTEEALREANEDLRARAEQLQTAGDMLQTRQRELETTNEDLREQERELCSHALALRESEERYRKLFESAPDAIVVHRDGRFLAANEALLRLVGVGDFQELAAHTVLDFFRPQDREQAAERMRLAVAGHLLPAREATLRRLDGQELVVEFHTGPIDFEGAPAIQTIIHDITDRKRTDEALREAHERAVWLARFPEENPNPVLRASVEGAVLYCNPATAELPGWTCDTGGPLGEPLLSLVAQAMAEQCDVQQDVELAGRFYSVSAMPFPAERYVNLYGRDVTERKRAEQALQQSQKTFAELIERAPFGIYVVDAQFRIAHMNASSQDGAFRNVRPVIGRDFAEAMRILWPEEVAAQIIGVFRHTLETGEPYYSPRFTNPRADVGITESYEWELRRMTLPDGQYGVVCYYYDSTRLREAEEALRESEERFRAVFESTSDCILVWDRQYSYLYANQAAIDHVGTTRDKVIGKSIRDGLGHVPDFMRLWIQRVDQAFTTGESFRVEDAVLVGDRLVYSESQVSPIRDAAGRVFAVGVVYRDVTDRKRAEEALRISESAMREQANRLQAVLDAAPAIIWIAHDRECRRITGNRAAREFSRVDDGSVNLSKTGPALERLAHYRVFANGLELQPQDMPLQVVTRSGKELRGHAIEFHFDDGTIRSLIGNVIPLLDEQGRPEGALAAFLDITEEKQAKESLRELAETLESKVAQRTAELEHRAKQLQKLTLELSQAEERERKRLAVVLHEDLQQQIAGARFHLSLLNNPATADAPQAIVDRVGEMLKEAIEKSRRLSHELSPAVLHRNDLAEVLRWLAQQMRTKHGLAVSVTFSGDMTLQLEALAMFLFRAAQELLFNVIKHARVGEARIRVRRLGRYVCVSVSDQGPGFDPQALKQTAGFGLLSIRERVELLGGRMTINSANGNGSTFHIVVPDGELSERDIEHARGLGQEMPVERGASSQPRNRPRLRVLLADDHTVVREALVGLLRDDHSIEVIGQAENGREAVDLAWRLRPDVVVMDVTMPLMNGDEATRQIKSQLPGTRVVALSLHDEPEIVEKMREAGAEDFVLKTASSRELLAAIVGKP